ncbi:MAG: UDP-N-acetylmuramoyl-L-alanyl-D-glutamate--2,6-diaminopimelate ligase [Bacilli bacterium]|nr:UDP-N-acetylmuramoyl-L-alanyl-D-glutamate--2,6-diaminopimelate ligase [Bacilli bacterium]
MKKLGELYDGYGDIPITGVKINSKEVSSGDIFVCTMGVNADRHDFIDDAILNGASAIVVSRDNIERDIPVIKVDDTNEELPLLCRKFYDFPDSSLKIVGVTGTDGKTTTSTIIQTLIGNITCGYIGTNGRSCSSFKRSTNNTTPDSDKLYKYFREFVDSGCDTVVMEASSEAFFRRRLTNLSFDVSVITNITSEHLNIHGSFSNYVDCKCQLFRQTKSDGVCVLNRDDEFYDEVLKNCNSRVVTYGKSSDNTLQILSYNVTPKCTYIKYKYGDVIYDITSPLLGDFNVYNLAAALLACLVQGYEMNDLIKNIDKLFVDGRLEMLDTDTPYYVMVDYAHTPNGIINMLNFVHTLDINRSIVVIGSAGERDNLKRPLMGEAVLSNTSYAIFTSEDPRSEDPLDIINDLIKTAKDSYDNYEIVVDRRRAIRRAIDIAGENDMVLILGKGNETYQKLKDETIYFNDIEEAYLAVKIRKERENKSLVGN